ncbi:MAG: D-glycero-beta-D-manno-heptose 1-phosphate adenylyltransferase [Bacteroidales bacterium]|nr:D-glycero-beta-D-manno-heptose 1-phosphate adenylyltransferase [Bacteroidales bacterium]MDD4741609.1 D-glycero-beta-D-manno-heptose 1-phosphate adenylyltransferase [Bacteroidales bacterium]
MQHLLNIQSKIFPQANDDLGRLVAYWNFKNQKIVFTNGCFDILHRGHIDYLAKAADLGNVLVVGLNADASVSRLKGAGRPVQDQDGRALVLAALRFVSAVVLFDEDTPYQLIKAVQPDVLVKGSDYKTDDIVGADIVKAKGGSVQTIDFLEGYSTSGIIRRLLASSQDK